MPLMMVRSDTISGLAQIDVLKSRVAASRVRFGMKKRGRGKKWGRLKGAYPGVKGAFAMKPYGIEDIGLYTG